MEDQKAKHSLSMLTKNLPMQLWHSWMVKYLMAENLTLSIKDKVWIIIIIQHKIMITDATIIGMMTEKDEEDIETTGMIEGTMMITTIGAEVENMRVRNLQEFCL